MTLAAIIPALRVSNVKLADARIVMFGSGTAGTGIANQICGAIAQETGKPRSEAARQIWCLDKQGLLLKSQGEQLTPAQIPFARDDTEWNTKSDSRDSASTPDLLSVVKTVKPHVLIGTSTKPKAFTADIIREMARHTPRPIVFPLSNPTRLHEADPKDINEWTDGRALMATGSPFPPVERNGTQYEIGMWKRLCWIHCDHTFSGLFVAPFLIANTAQKRNVTTQLASLVLVWERSYRARGSCPTECWLRLLRLWRLVRPHLQTLTCLFCPMWRRRDPLALTSPKPSSERRCRRVWQRSRVFLRTTGSCRNGLRCKCGILCIDR